MAGRNRSDEPLRAEIEQFLEFGSFITDGEMSRFTDGLETVEKKLKALVTGDQAVRAAVLYEVS